MFEQYADYLWITLFIAIVLYGASNTISVPFRVKRFYRNLGFEDRGRNGFDSDVYSDSQLLAGLMTSRYYCGEYNGQQMEQFEAVSKQRRKFTVNRVIRKRNQQVYTITVLQFQTPVAGFCARPLRVPEAAEYVLHSDPVLFPEDDAFARVIHVVADDHAAVRKQLVTQVREYLNGIDPLSLEVVGSLLIHKRPRQPHDTGKQLKVDIDALLKLGEALRLASPLTQAG